MAPTVVQKVEVVIGAKALYDAQLKRAKAKFVAAGKAIGAGIAIGAAAATVAIGALTVIMRKGTAAAKVQEDAETRLTAALGHRSQALLDQASAIQLVTKFGDESVIAAQSLIASFVKEEEQIKLATAATVDLAAAKGMDLVNAADLVSKTLGSSTNALSRYGIAVEGAVGSTERLESLVTGISNVFGGQAAAQALTYSGRITQMSNAFGDMLEEIGFVVTKNKFLNEAISAGTKLFAGWAQQIKDNRLFLMALAKDGFGSIVSGIGAALEIMRFFHNGWLGLKLVIASIAVVAADTLRFINESIRVILAPLDLIFEAAVKLGTIDVNPFDSMIAGTIKLQESSREMGASILEDIEVVNGRYDTATQTVKNFQSTIAGFKAEELALPDAGVGVISPEAEEESPATQLAQKEANKIISIQAAKFERLSAMRQEFGLSEEERANLDLERQLAEFEADRLRLEENNLLTAELKEQFRQAEINAVALHQAKLTNIESQEAKKRAQSEQKVQSTIIGMRSTVLRQSVGLLKALGSESKVAAFAAIALEKGLAIGQTIMATQVAQMMALAQLGPIAGPPMAATIGAWGAASVGIIAATGLLQAAGGGGGGIGGGGAAIGTAAAPLQTQEVETPLISDQAGEVQQTQRIEVNIITDGIITAETMDRHIEMNLGPALKRAVDRDVEIHANINKGS